MFRKFLLWLLDLFRLKLDPELELKVEREAEEGRKLDRQGEALLEADRKKEEQLAVEAENRVEAGDEGEFLAKRGQEIDRELEEVRSEKTVLPDRSADVLRADL